MASWWVDVRDAIENVVGDAAPIVLSALGGPAGAAVGGMIASALGVSSTSQISAAIATDPAAAAKIRELEIQKGLDIATMDAQARTAQIRANEAGIKRLGLFGAWEDAVGWVCAAIFAEAFLILPVAQSVAAWTHHTLLGWPVFHLDVILSVLGTLLGTSSLKRFRIGRK
jgi:hypothetical protein